MAASTSAINASLLLLFAFSLAPTRSEAPAEEVLVSSVETAPIPRGWGTSTAAVLLFTTFPPSANSNYLTLVRLFWIYSTV